MTLLFFLCVPSVPAVLGNHDYTGNALAQQDPAIRDVDSRYLNLAKSFIVNSG
jgi:tartrate-resistant acid phosphatase type 5